MGNRGSRQAGHENRRSQEHASLSATRAAGKSGSSLCGKPRRARLVSMACTCV
ncbi:hypothetical protein PXO_05447 [Xanthomonas oryzae pv. oryzae PXO99A]|nr:hypothetical protein PXO_05447 [Xanthomonas oryzae pv. oryzae PXO99A]